MRITVSPSNGTQLEIKAVELDSRLSAVRWVKVLQKQIDILWSEQKPEAKK